MKPPKSSMDFHYWIQLFCVEQHNFLIIFSIKIFHSMYFFRQEIHILYFVEASASTSPALTKKSIQTYSLLLRKIWCQFSSSIVFAFSQIQEWMQWPNWDGCSCHPPLPALQHHTKIWDLSPILVTLWILAVSQPWFAPCESRTNPWGSANGF